MLDFTRATELNQFTLKLIGLWPKNPKELKGGFVSNIQASFYFIIMILTIIPLIWSLVQVWSDMILMVDNLQVTLTLITSCLKFVIMRWKQSGK